MNTTVFGSLGRRDYDDNGQEVVQVYDGEGKPEFEKRYWQAIEETRWFLEALAEEPKTKCLQMWEDKIKALKDGIAGGYGHERKIIQVIKDLRYMIKTLVAPHDPTHDLRRGACQLECRWKADTDYRYEAEDVS